MADFCPVKDSFIFASDFLGIKKESRGVSERSGNEDLIIVELHGAKNVLPMDRNERSDPLVITKLACPLINEKEEKANLKVLHGNTVGFIQKNFYRSSIIYRTLNPVWEESYIFWVDPKAKPDSLVLKFELFDWDLIGADHLGRVSLTLDELKQYTSLTTLELPISIEGIKQKGKDKDKKEFGGTLNFGVVYVKKNDLATHHLVAENHMEGLMNLFFEKPLSIPVTACAACAETTEEMSQSICCLSLEANKARELCKELVRVNVSETVQETTLFRTNSTATKMVRTLFTQTGLAYIKNAIGETITKVLDDPTGYEINQAKLSNSEKTEEKALHPNATDKEICANVLQKNKQKLHTTCAELVGAVSKSLDTCPVLLCQILSDVRAIVEARFPDSCLTAVGGFYFLRFVVPCVATPEHHGMTSLTSISGAQRRALTVISKVIQNMANKKSFDHKEGFMTMMNDTLDELTPSVQKFLDNVSKREQPLEEIVVDVEDVEQQTKPIQKASTFLRGTPCAQAPKAKVYPPESVESMAYFIARLSNSYKTVHQKMVDSGEPKQAELLTVIHNRLEVACEVTEAGTNSLLRSMETGADLPQKSHTARSRLASTNSSAKFHDQVVPSALAQASSKKKVLWKTGGDSNSDTIDLAGNKTFSFTKEDLPPGPYVLRFGVLPVLVTQMTVNFTITFLSACKREIAHISMKLCHTDNEEMRTVTVSASDGPATMIFSCTTSLGLVTMRVRASLAQGEKTAFFGRGRLNQPGTFS